MQDKKISAVRQSKFHAVENCRVWAVLVTGTPCESPAAAPGKPTGIQDRFPFRVFLLLATPHFCVQSAIHDCFDMHATFDDASGVEEEGMSGSTMIVRR